MACLSPTACTFNENHVIHEKNNLPSPPNSSCGEEREPELTTSTLPTAHYTTDSSENYTIDHSKPHIIRQDQYTLKLPKDHRVQPSLTASSSSSSPSSSVSLKRSLPLTSDDDNSDVDDSSKTTEKPKRKKPALLETHRCDECGKLYKHLKSLFKHQWEHSEYWEASSKLSLTKHQQVQMLEAASILTSMKKQATLKQQESDDDDDDFEQQQHQQDDEEEEEAEEQGEDDDEEISLI